MKRIKLIIVFLITLVICLIFYGFLIEPKNLEVTHIYPDNPVLKEKLKGKIVVHLSDMHMEKFGPMEQKILFLLLYLGNKKKRNKFYPRRRRRS